MGELVGVRLTSKVDIVRVMRTGLPASAYETLGRHISFDPAVFGAKATRRRRLTEQASLSLVESERLFRLARILALAEGVFGDEARASRWCNQASDHSLGDQLSPVQMCRTEFGGRILEEHLLRAMYGFTA